MPETTNVQLHEKPVTSDAVCDFLGISPKTLITYENELALPVHRIHAGTRAPKRYYLSEVNAWLRSRCSRPAPSSANR
jgi:predicted DNA-binding transcriptional regulator AlpA